MTFVWPCTSDSLAFWASVQVFYMRSYLTLLQRSLLRDVWQCWARRWKSKLNVWVVVPLLNEHDKKCFLFQKFLLANKAPTLSKNSITSLRHFPVKAVCSLVPLLSEFYIQFWAFYSSKRFILCNTLHDAKSWKITQRLLLKVSSHNKTLKGLKSS